MKKKNSYAWFNQKLSPDCQVISCPEFDPIKGFRRDPTGYYVLIKINFENLRIELAVSDKDHTIIAVFKGRNARDIYNAIFNYEKKTKVVFFKEKQHIAYLGKELKKAEIALAQGNSGYFQE